MRPKEDGRAGKHTDAFAVANGGWVAVSVIANGAQAAGEDVTEIAPDELGAGDGLGFELVVGAVFPEEGDGPVGERNDSTVGNDAASNVVAKITNGMGTGTGGPDVDAPGLSPDGGIDLPIFGIEFESEMVPEGRLQKGKVNQIVSLANRDDLAIAIESGPWYQEMNVGMKLHLLAPGVEDGEESADRGIKALSGGEFLSQGGRRRSEKDIVELLGKGTKEAGTKFLGESECDHEIGRVDLFEQSALDPSGGGGFATTGTALMVAAMESEVMTTTTWAGITSPSHGRGSAMGDGPNGATLYPRKRRVGLQERGQKPIQHRSDGRPSPLFSNGMTGHG